MTNAPPVAGEADPVALGEALRALRAALLAHRNLPESLRQANPRLLDDLWWRLRGIPGRLAEALVAHGSSPVGPSNLGELVDAFRDRVSDWRSSVSSTYRGDEEGLRTALEGGPAPETTEEELGRIFERPGELAPMRPGLLQIIGQFADLASSLAPETTTPRQAPSTSLAPTMPGTPPVMLVGPRGEAVPLRSDDRSSPVWRVTTAATATATAPLAPSQVDVARRRVVVDLDEVGRVLVDGKTVPFSDGKGKKPPMREDRREGRALVTLALGQPGLLEKPSKLSSALKRLGTGLRAELCDGALAVLDGATVVDVVAGPRLTAREARISANPGEASAR